MRRPWSLRCGGAGIAHHTFPAAGLLALLPLFATIARMAFAVMVRNLHPQLSPSRRDDRCSESRCLWHHGGMVLLSTFVFIPKGSVARIIVPIAGAVGVLTVIFAVPNAKEE